LIFFIPDISGFTSFVKEVDISHAKHIIKELLELLIEKGKRELKLAEIEGDALFFYTEDKKLNADQLNVLIEEMHKAFHNYLNIYRYRRVCNCGACTTANELQVKFIVHQGEAEMLEVGKSKKPFGQEVILAHRMLKNSVPSKEYILWSNNFWEENHELISKHWPSKIEELHELYDGVEKRLYYSTLSLPAKQKDYSLSFPQLQGIRPLIIEHRFEVNKDDLYQYVIDLGKRMEWSQGLDDLQYGKRINEAGTTHTCIVNGKHV